jgi:ABC-2 type transport system permease protein
MAFAQAVAFRGAGIGTVWPELLTIFGLGAVFLTGSLARFRNTISS